MSDYADTRQLSGAQFRREVGADPQKWAAQFLVAYAEAAPIVVWQLVDQHGAVGARAIMDEKGNLHLEVVSGIFETVKIVRGEAVNAAATDPGMRA